jgi:hypothetical protein
MYTAWWQALSPPRSPATANGWAAWGLPVSRYWSMSTCLGRCSHVRPARYTAVPRVRRLTEAAVSSARAWIGIGPRVSPSLQQGQAACACVCLAVPPSDAGPILADKAVVTALAGRGLQAVRLLASFRDTIGMWVEWAARCLR